MKRSILLRALLGAALPLFATEESPAAVGAPATDAAAGAVSAEGELSVGAPAAADAPANGTSSSAAPALPSGGTEAEGAQQGDGATIISAEKVTLVSPAVSMNAVADPLPAVSIHIENHAEARERFAGALAALHDIEGAAAAALRAELDVIGTLLHLHSFASSQAGATGSYSPADL
ncbi:hypothetical protein [Burkholderia gladioli]|uniref:hypothetical protein n=1 Tax=Burkholderia gladioli TaxID=28095 RepID=UPI0016419791|nr:hypothetical protein [Burkholderia gladioli]